MLSLIHLNLRWSRLVKLAIYTTDPDAIYKSNKSHNTLIPYPTIHHLGIEICTFLFQCIVVYRQGLVRLIVIICIPHKELWLTEHGPTPNKDIYRLPTSRSFLGRMGCLRSVMHYIYICIFNEIGIRFMWLSSHKLVRMVAIDDLVQISHQDIYSPNSKNVCIDID